MPGDEPPTEGDHVNVDLKMRLGAAPFEMRVRLPAGPASAESVLPFARRFSDAVIASVVEETTKTGRAISCRAGCGACCRQVVPVTETEARRLRKFVEAMPEPRRSAIRERFAQAQRVFAEAGMLEQLVEPHETRTARWSEFAVRYFRQGVACPFLEDESCSIYEERPLICREYLVTSPAENCAQVATRPVEGVGMPVRVSRQLGRLTSTEPDRDFRWIPLVVSLDWADAHPEPPPTRTGPELFTDFFHLVTGKVADLPPDLREPPQGGTVTA